MAVLHCIRPGILSGGAKIVEARSDRNLKTNAPVSSSARGREKTPRASPPLPRPQPHRDACTRSTFAALRLVHGVGDRKIAAYGPAFVNAVRQFLGQ
jgi:hypothetical protein